MNMIETTNLTKKYGTVLAVDRVSLTLGQGEIYGLIGKNGAGKTTLFKLLMGLSAADGGSIALKGSASSQQLEKARSQIGFMMGNNFFPYLSAKQNLDYFRKVKGITDAKEVDRVLELVEMKGITKKFKTFSMGMKQRIGIANALMGNPDVILLDEPINGLDPQGISDIRKLIQKLNQETNITFIISSHILGELSIMATKFGFIHNGKLIRELSREALHQQTQQALIIKVDRVEQAAVVLEETLNINNYKINEHRELVLFEAIDRSPEIVHQLVHSGLKLFKIQPVETTLEQYFFDLIGGEEHA